MRAENGQYDVRTNHRTQDTVPLHYHPHIRDNIFTCYRFSGNISTSPPAKRRSDEKEHNAVENVDAATIVDVSFNRVLEP